MKIFCDNEAVVTILNSGRTRDPFLAAIARNIFMSAAVSDIYLKIVHIPGKKNVVADLLSRWENNMKNLDILASHLGTVEWVIYRTMSCTLTLTFKTLCFSGS